MLVNPRMDTLQCMQTCTLDSPMMYTTLLVRYNLVLERFHEGKGTAVEVILKLQKHIQFYLEGI